MRKRDGSDYRPNAGETPVWTALCLGNNDFFDLMSQHFTEFVSNYDVDRAWLDRVRSITDECYCEACIRKIKANGKDPFDRNVQRQLQNKNFIAG